MNKHLKLTLAISLKMAVVWLCTFNSTLAQSGSSKPMMKENSSMKKTMKMQETKMHGSTEPFAFIELFTSEGCSSCPSADKNLERIADRAKSSGQNVYTLSYHVDYWDYLGWKDPYGSKAFSERQRKYAQQFESSRVYTPQMIINGQAEFVGSDRKKSDRAIELATKIPPQASVKVDAVYADGRVKVAWQGGNGNGDLHIALVQNKGQQSVTRGENARRKLSHVNVVRDMKSSRNAKAAGRLEFVPPKGFSQHDFHVVGFIQTSRGVVAASKSSIKSAAGMNKMHKPGMKKVGSYRVTKTKRQSTSLTSVRERRLVAADRFLEMLSGDFNTFRRNLDEVRQNWNVAYVPMMLEVGRFLPPAQRSAVIGVVESKTGQKFGFDFDKWMQWNWKQKYDQHPEYAKFKSELYRKIDPRFAEYFATTENSQIRLDEIRWGGVVRDGIPPLKNPKMVAANQATYLADSDVVFGIELNGDARAYPKRILAWHEMFKDTIGGESVAGVY